MAAKRKRVTDSTIQDAIRERILDEIREKTAAASIGGGQVPPSGAGASGIFNQMTGGASLPDVDPGLFDYFVDIERMPGEQEGSWTKKVHRYRTPRGGSPSAPPPGKSPKKGGGQKKK